MSLQGFYGIMLDALCLRDSSDFLLFPGKDEIIQICPCPHLIYAFENFLQRRNYKTREIHLYKIPSQKDLQK